MKKTVYDFQKAIKVLDEWFKPSELSSMLKDAALSLAPLSDYCNDNRIAEMQMTVLNACDFLDAIEVKEVEE